MKRSLTLNTLGQIKNSMNDPTLASDNRRNPRLSEDFVMLDTRCNDDRGNFALIPSIAVPIQSMPETRARSSGLAEAGSCPNSQILDNDSRQPEQDPVFFIFPLPN